MPSARLACILAIILAFVLVAAPGAWTSVFAGSALSPEARWALGALFAGWASVLFQPERRMSWLVPGALACLNDWLAYEGNARDILHEGLPVTGGKPLGQGDPFFWLVPLCWLFARTRVALPPASLPRWLPRRVRTS